MPSTRCFICQKAPAIEGDLICEGCTKRKAGVKVCGYCGTGTLVESMRLTNIVYYDCDNEACGKRQMVQVGGER